MFLVVKVLVSEDPPKWRWRCLCGLEERIGFPCVHLTKILIINGVNLKDYFCKRWIIDQNAADKSEVKKELDKLKMRKVTERKLYNCFEKFPIKNNFFGEHSA